MKDPAFLYYDGDAARDVSHMNRLERGCYFDLIQAQRKFRGFTMEQARKILGKDFEECWSAIELILEVENEIYFIPWVKASMSDRAAFKEKQRNRIQTYWDKKNDPSLNHGNTTVLPINSENANEDVIGISERGSGGKLILDYNEIEVETLYEDVWLDDTARAQETDKGTVVKYLKKFIALQRSEKPGKRDLDDFRRHFSRWLIKELLNKPVVPQHNKVEQDNRTPLLPEVIKHLESKGHDVKFDEDLSKEQKNIIRDYWKNLNN